MKKYIYILIAVMALSACQKDILTSYTGEAGFHFIIPTSLTDAKLSNIQLTAKEANTGLETTLEVSPEGTLSRELPYGSYTLNFHADITYSVGGQQVSGKSKSYVESVIINSDQTAVDCKFFLANDDANFVIKELFFAGNNTPEGKSYNGDKYFLIYNNSDSVLYADGLLISQSKFLTSAKYEYTPNVMDEAFTTSQIIMIPGDGDDYPIQPGAQFIIANNAINHLEYNKNSIDLSNAEFEIDLIATINIDNPQVPNTIGLTGSLLMNNQGLQSFVIAKLPKGMTTDQFLADNYYNYTWKNVLGNTQSGSGYKIPNSYIIDAVNLGIPKNYQWIVTSPELDMGYTYISEINSDANRFGKSVIRKVLSTTADGKDILQDTNNSGLDFQVSSKPSLTK